MKQTKNKGETLQTTESIGVTEMQTEIQNKVSEYKKAWLNHLDDFKRLLWNMRDADELAQFNKASESMARIIGIATANYENTLNEGEVQ